MPVLPLPRVKVSDGNLRKEIVGELKNPNENPGQILLHSSIIWTLDSGTCSVVKLSATLSLRVWQCCPIDKLCLSYFDVDGSSLDASHWIKAGFGFSKWTKGVETFQKVSNSFGGRWHWLSCRSGDKSDKATTSHPQLMPQQCRKIVWSMPAMSTLSKM